MIKKRKFASIKCESCRESIIMDEERKKRKLENIRRKNENKSPYMQFQEYINNYINLNLYGRKPNAQEIRTVSENFLKENPWFAEFFEIENVINWANKILTTDTNYSRKYERGTGQKNQNRDDDDER